MISGNEHSHYYYYIQLSFGCCDAHISPFADLIKEFLILILRSEPDLDIVLVHIAKLY